MSIEKSDGLLKARERILEVKNSMGTGHEITTLDLGGLELDSIPDEIGTLTGLKKLTLSLNNITDIKNLEQLEKLTELYLGGNQISEIKNVDKLVNLTVLNLGNNRISEIENLDKLVNLSTLILWYNQIKEVKNLDKLINLKVLFLSFNQISVIASLGQNPKFEILDLSRNKIKDVPEKFLESFQVFNSNHVSFKENTVNLYGNPLTYEFELALNSGKQAIQDYFFNLNQGEVPLREAKLMILGESEAGKTNLRNYLMAKPFNDKQSATIGIKIDHWKLKKQDQEYRINIWDFGGQWMQEQVHRFFITESCVYVLMIDARKGTSPVEWLDWILSHGKNSKVILVANRMDDLNDQSFEFKTNELKNKYPDLIHSFHYISLKKVSESVEAAKQNLFHLHDSILNCIFSLANIEENVSANIFSLKKKLEDEVFASKPYISHDYFNELAKDIRISDGGHYILTLYNRLGTIRYIDTQSKYILNPEWLSSGIYRLIISERTQQLKGILTLENFKQILQKTDEYTQEYDPKHDYPFLMDLMEEFKLAYISPNRKKVFIPKQFNQDIPIYIKEDEMFRSDYIHYYFDYEAYFPDSLISQFIASMFGEVDGENYWREGIILKDNEDSSGSTLALISSNSYTNRITIKLKGSDIFRQAYFVKIRSELIKLQKDLNYKYTEYVVDSEHQLAISYKKLITFLNNGEREIKEDKDGRIVNIDILKILGYIENNKATMSNLYIQNNFAFVQFHYQDTLNEQLKNIESLLSQLSDKEDIETLKKIIDDLKSSLNQSDPKEDKSIFEKVMEDIKNFPELMKSEGMKIIAKEILFTAYRNLNSMHSSLLKILESGLNTGNFIN